MKAAFSQPPSGGCVLKPTVLFKTSPFGMTQPPSGGCVLKLISRLGLNQKIYASPAAFRRLCVETNIYHSESRFDLPSRLQAAVC